MSKDSCELCHIIENKKDYPLIYEDKKAIAMMSTEPASIGHVVVFLKQHTPILEMIPDYDVGYLFAIANKISIAVFQGLSVEATNIIVQNGVSAGQHTPHCSLHIIPRSKGDGLSLEWQPKQLSEEEMSTIELQLKKECAAIKDFKKIEEVLPPKMEKKIEKAKESYKNYLFRQIERIP